MTKTLIFILLLYSSNILSQRVFCDSLQGIGFLQFSKKSTIDIYNEDLTIYKKIKKSDHSKYDFIWQDCDSEFIKILCLEETDSTYIVLINEQKDLKKIVLKNPNINLQKMEDYILDASTICNRNSLKKEINGQSVLLRGDLIKPVKIVGDWLMVESTYFEYDQEKWLTDQAWVQWRINDSIIISVLYLR